MRLKQPVLKALFSPKRNTRQQATVKAKESNAGQDFELEGCRLIEIIALVIYDEMAIQFCWGYVSSPLLRLSRA